jgi:hypothetical protein
MINHSFQHKGRVMKNLNVFNLAKEKEKWMMS